MRALLSQLRLDALVAWRGRFVHASLGMALLFGLLLRFAVPDRVESGFSEYLHDGTTSGLFAEAVEVAGPRAMEDPAALRRAVEEDGGTVGVILAGDATRPSATFVIQGHESPRMRALMQTMAVEGWRAVLDPDAPTIPTRQLRPSQTPPPLGASLLPLLFSVDTALLGFMLASVMVLQEKAHGTIRAFRVTSGGTALYLGSKLIVNVGIGLLAAALMTGLAWPAGLLSLPTAALVGTAVAALTLLGIGLAVFFNSLTEFFYPLAVVGLLLSLPMMAWGLPSLAAASWMRFIPTWPLLFGAREALFPAGHSGLLGASLAQLGLTTLLCGGFAVWAVHQRLLREVR